MKSSFASRYLAALLLLASAWRMSAESIPPFDLDTDTGEASVIVLGRLRATGDLYATQVLKGTPTASGIYQIDTGANEFKSLIKGMAETGDPEVVAFLSEPQKDGSFRLARGFIGMVGVSSKDMIFAWLDAPESFSGSAFQAHPSWTKAGFLSDLKRSVQTKGELEVLLAKPRSQSRMTEMIAFLHDHAMPLPVGHDNGQFWYGRGYLFSQAMVKLFKLDAEEEKVLADHLQKAELDDEKAFLLAVINGARASRGLYEKVLPFVAPTASPKVRKESLSALAAIDPYAAAGVFAHYLSIDEPELDHVLSTLNNMHEPRPLNAEVIAPLEALGRKTLERCRARRYDTDNNNRGYQVLAVLGNYFHPSFLPLMREWANDSSVTTSGQAASNLRFVLGISQLPENPARIRKWWERNQGRLTRSYNLSTWGGVSEWMREYRASADTITEYVMLRLWDFQPNIPEKELLEACKGDDAMMAKSLLSELWQRKRLSAETRLAIVRDYLRMKIEKDPPNPKGFKSQELRVVPVRQFPFPPAAGVGVSGELTTRGEPQIRESSYAGGRSLESVEYFLSTSGGEVGRPAKAVLELWETDYQLSPPLEIWRMRWEVNEQGCGAPKIIKPLGQ